MDDFSILNIQSSLQTVDDEIKPRNAFPIGDVNV